MLPGRLSEVMGCVLSCRFLGLATSAVHDHHGEARSCNFHPALHSRQTGLRLLLSRSSDWSGVIRVSSFFVPKRLSVLMLRCHFGFAAFAFHCSLLLERSRLCLGKLVGVKGPASQPDQPHRFQDLALGV